MPTRINFILLSLLLLGCRQQAQAPVAIDAASLPERMTAAHLPNPIRVHEKVISGGAPEGEDSFRELRDLGVKTVISVDGARPDVELAARYGLRYVHLPHGFDGIADDRASELSKAVRDLEGPIYIHCHHGKHRSPTAAAVACVGAGLIEPAAATAVLQLAGTSPNYRGLYQSAATAHRIEDETLDKLPGDFPKVAKLPALAEAMVALEHTHDHVKQLAGNGWKQLAAKPDLTAAHEALLLREHFEELLRMEDVQTRPAVFRALAKEGHEAAQALETELEKQSAADPAVASALLERINNNCTACHRQFRDVPLDERLSRFR